MACLALSSAFTAVLLVATASLSVVQAQNTYPIVLVHGFLGWGRDELLGVKYWGGIQGDIQEELVAQGYTVYTASIGPFASNWDRACELYAQIKGGQVDYGVKHSAKHGHERYGRNYAGLYPEWGETNADGSVKKLHFVGHSMGGQTSRMLAQMLEKGTTGAPVEEDASSHPLFAGGKDWVHSITTIATPNQGTTLADGLAQIGDTVKSLLASVLSVIGIAGDEAALVYDAQLEQWGITNKQDGESLSTYLKRVFSASIFEPGFKDVCLWSLSTGGAKEESTWVETLSSVYYFSYATVDTFEAVNWKLQKISLPNVLTMLLPLHGTATFLGSRYAVDTVGLSTDWQPNDGIVNTVSQSRDFTGSLVKYAGAPHKGKWNSMTQLTGLDHEAIKGFSIFYEIFDVYLAHAELLTSLPADTGSRRLTAEDSVTAAALALLANASVSAAITSLNEATGSISTVSEVEARCANPATMYAAVYCANLLSSVVVATNSTGGSTTAAIIESSSTRHLRGVNN